MIASCFFFVFFFVLKLIHRLVVLLLPPKELAFCGTKDRLSREELVPYKTRDAMVGVEALY
jgi:hypothetical protein